jgi:hypothetical protein
MRVIVVREGIHLVFLFGQASLPDSLDRLGHRSLSLRPACPSRGRAVAAGLATGGVHRWAGVVLCGANRSSARSSSAPQGRLLAEDWELGTVARCVGVHPTGSGRRSVLRAVSSWFHAQVSR